MSSSRAWPLATLVLFAALATVTLLGLGDALGNGDEIIYAQNIREMRTSGEWGVLQWQGVNTFQRPTLPFVLSMFGESLAGGETGLRLPMALFSLMTLALVYFGSWFATRRHDAASIATVLCASVPSYHLFTRSLLSDAPFVTMTTLALLGTLWALRDKRGIIVATAGIGGAIAVKSMAAGPIALALSPWLVYALYRHRAYATLLPASAAFSLLAVPYYLYSYLRFGSAFLEGHFGWTLGKRVAGDYGDTVGLAGGVTAYGSHMWNADGPAIVLWIVLAAIGGLYLWRRGNLAAGCSATTACATLVFFSVMGTRLPHYILPIYPAFAIALACVYASVADRWAPLGEALPRALLATLILGVALVGVTRPTNPQYLLPSPAAVEIGRRVAQERSELPLYTLDWYAPAAAYYADKPWLAIFHSESLVSSLNKGTQFFEEAGNIRSAPPWPRGHYFLAGPSQALREDQLPPASKLLLEVAESYRLVEIDGND